MKARVRDALHGDRRQHINVVGKCNAGQLSAQRELFDAPDCLTNDPGVPARRHVTLQECAHNPHGQASLLNADGVLLRGQNGEVTQPAFQNVQRMQNVYDDAVRQLQFRRPAANFFSIEPDDSRKEIDLLDTLVRTVAYTLATRPPASSSVPSRTFHGSPSCRCSALAMSLVPMKSASIVTTRDRTPAGWTS